MYINLHHTARMLHKENLKICHIVENIKENFSVKTPENVRDPDNIQTK